MRVDNRESGPAADSDCLASSADGRSFQFSAIRENPFETGSLVSLIIDASQPLIGQIHQLTLRQGAGFEGSGRILGATGMDTTNRLQGFTDARVVAADRSVLGLLQSSSGATLEVGTFLSTDNAEAKLVAKRFNRHTFWCGQSGSGKTYALGVVLEELLLRTRLPLLIFDPNADFVRLREAAEGASPDPGAVLGSRNIRILRPGTPGTEPLGARFSTMSTRAKAAVLRLDPLVDRDEYNNLLHLENLFGGTEPDAIIARLRSSESPGSNELASRIENLRLADWTVWARHNAAASEIVDDRPDATVLDLGGFDTPDEPLVVALSVLDSLWDARSLRRPILIVIDEAHNLCSPDHDSPLHRAVRERIIQIAAEGRKFGLWLLLSTQRPSKIDQNIVSQCDNLALMKMSSPSDLAELAKTFGYVPQSMLERAFYLQQGEALFAGGFVPAASVFKMRRRFTEEGGSDVRVPMRPEAS